jgi:hypothetical protein
VINQSYNSFVPDSIVSAFLPVRPGDLTIIIIAIVNASTTRWHIELRLLFEQGYDLDDRHSWPQALGLCSINELVPLT